MSARTGWVPPGAGLAPFASYLQSRKPAEVAEQCSGKYCLSVKLSLPGSSKVVGQPGAPELGDQSPLQRLVVALAWTKAGGYALRSREPSKNRRGLWGNSD